MPAIKESPGKFSTRSPGARLSRLTWWFIVLMVLGLLSAAVTLVWDFTHAKPKPLRGLQSSRLESPRSEVLPLAVLAIVGGDLAERASERNQGSTIDLKQYILSGVLIIIAIV